MIISFGFGYRRTINYVKKPVFPEHGKSREMVKHQENGRRHCWGSTGKQNSERQTEGDF